MLDTGQRSVMATLQSLGGMSSLVDMEDYEEEFMLECVHGMG